MWLDYNQTGQGSYINMDNVARVEVLYSGPEKDYYYLMFYSTNNYVLGRSHEFSTCKKAREYLRTCIDVCIPAYVP